MRALKTLTVIAIAAFGLVAFAADNPMLFTWKLNTAKSRIDGALPGFIHDGYIRPRPQSKNVAMPYNPDAPVHLVWDGPDGRSIYQGVVSPDGHVLTLTQQENPHHSVLVLEKQ